MHWVGCYTQVTPNPGKSEEPEELSYVTNWGTRASVLSDDICLFIANCKQIKSKSKSVSLNHDYPG